MQTTVGFANELIKMGSISSTLAEFINSIKNSPGTRRALLHSAGLGAATGAVAGLAGGGPDPTFKRMMRGAVGGGAGGLITGAAFPHWFTR